MPRPRVSLRAILIVVVLSAFLIKFVGLPLWERFALSQAERLQRATLAGLARPLDLPFTAPTPLSDVLKYIKGKSPSPPGLPNGFAIYVDPVGLQEAGATMQTPVQITTKGLPAGKALEEVLKPLGLGYTVNDGLLTITSRASLQRARKAVAHRGP